MAKTYTVSDGKPGWAFLLEDGVVVTGNIPRRLAGQIAACLNAIGSHDPAKVAELIEKSPKVWRRRADGTFTQDAPVFLGMKVWVSYPTCSRGEVEDGLVPLECEVCVDENGCDRLCICVSGGSFRGDDVTEPEYAPLDEGYASESDCLAKCKALSPAPSSEGGGR